MKRNIGGHGTPNPPFRLIGIAGDILAVRSILKAAEVHSETPFALMLRDPEHRVERVHQLAHEVLELPIPSNVSLLSNGCAVSGIEWRHLSSQELYAAENARHEGPFGCSVHSGAELRLAENVGASYVVLSPIWSTTSKPNAVPLGTPAFKEFCVETTLPVFALGGVSTAERAWQCLQAGAFGVAGIRLFAPESQGELQKVVTMLSLDFIGN